MRLREQVSPLLLLLCLAWMSLVPAGASSSPYESSSGVDRALFDPEIARIPADILVCYHNRTLWDR